MAPAEVLPLCVFGDGVQGSDSLTVLSRVRFSLFWCVYFPFSSLFSRFGEITRGSDVLVISHGICMNPCRLS